MGQQFESKKGQSRQGSWQTRSGFGEIQAQKNQRLAGCICVTATYAARLAIDGLLFTPKGEELQALFFPVRYATPLIALRSSLIRYTRQSFQ